MCARRLERSAKARPHSEHSYGFSPVSKSDRYVIAERARVAGHVTGDLIIMRSGRDLIKHDIPVCVRMCPCRSQVREKALPQMVHSHGKVCVRMCMRNAPSDEHSFWHTCEDKRSR